MYSIIFLVIKDYDSRNITFLLVISKIVLDNYKTVYDCFFHVNS